MKKPPFKGAQPSHSIEDTNPSRLHGTAVMSATGKYSAVFSGISIPWNAAVINGSHLRFDVRFS